MAVSPVPSPSSTFAPTSTSSGSSTSASATGTGSSSSSAGGPASLNEMDFLSLLTTQLKNQDPTKPMDDTQFVSQMAQFSSLQETQQLNQNFQSFNQNMSSSLDLQTLAQSSNLIGQEVFAGPDASDRTLGKVLEIRQQNGALNAVVQLPDNSTRTFTLDQIQQIGATAAEMNNYSEPSLTSSSASMLPPGYQPYSSATTSTTAA